MWDSLSTYGACWVITGAALPIAPFQSITLTLNDAYYQAAGSNYPPSLAGLTIAYIQVDTLNQVIETQELMNDPSNNVARLGLAVQIRQTWRSGRHR